MRPKFGIYVVLSAIVLVIGFTCVGINSASASSDFKPVTFKLATFYTNGHPNYEGPKKFAQMVSDGTKGLITVQLYPGQSLVPMKTEFDACSAGIIDMAYGIPAYYAGKVPVVGAVGFAFSAPTADDWIDILPKLTAVLDKETSKHGIKYLGLNIWVPYIIAGKKQIISQEDLNGLLIRTPGGYLGDSLKAIGGQAVAMPLSEYYLAAQRGTVDAVWTTPATYMKNKLFEVCSFVTWPPGSIAKSTALIMNKAAYDKVPPKFQKVIDKASLDAGTFAIQYTAGKLKEEWDKMKAAGATIYFLSEKEAKRWRDAGTPAWDKYIKAAGEPGQQAVKLLQKSWK